LHFSKKSRIARIKLAKNATSNAFINAKKKKEELSILRAQGITVEEKVENVFEEQHHHLLSCLEHATVINFLISDKFLKHNSCPYDSRILNSLKWIQM
jgi:potassium voltage-gated channel Shal-related subfamily D protein 2